MTNAWRKIILKQYRIEQYNKIFDGGSKKGIVCYGQNCNKLLKVDKLVWRHYTGQNSLMHRRKVPHSRYYCDKCYEKLWF